MRLPGKPLTRFLVGVLVLLVMALALWQLLLPQLLTAFLWLTATACKLLLAEHVIDVTAGIENQWQIVTSYARFGHPFAVVSFPLEPVRFTAGLPLLWALVLGTPGTRRLRNLALGTVLLTGAILVMLMATTLYYLLLATGPRPIAEGLISDYYVLTLPFSDVAAYVIAMLFRFAPLLIPIAAVIIWAFLNRRFLCEISGSSIFRSSIPGAGQLWSKFSRWCVVGSLVILSALGITNYDHRTVQYNRAIGALIGGELIQGREELGMLADSGHAKSQFKLGMLNASNSGGRDISIQVKNLIFSAADGNDLAAQYYLATFYASGQWFGKDIGKALHWYQIAAVRGYVPAQFQFGKLLAEHSETDEETVAAVRWMREAAQKYHVRAMRTLANWYQEGKYGLAKDTQLADNWRRSSVRRSLWIK